MLDLLSALCFAGFALAGALVVLTERRPAWRASALNAFLAYALVASFGAGLSQREAWPFSRWNFAAGRAAPLVVNSRVLAVDGAGLEHAVDARAWQPLGFDELQPWLLTTFPRLPRPARDRVAAALLASAEQARRAARAGRPFARWERTLGPLAAPSFVLQPWPWADAERVPPEPLVRLRVYRESWDQEERARAGERAVRRELLHDFGPR